MSKKSKKREEKKVKRPKKNSTDEVILPEEKPFDFGGLPDRNLKNNLGCG